ncbi:MAG: DUF664 domain-containing protein [Lapillicoccus sp.]
MDATSVFRETFGRMPDLVSAAVDGLDEDALTHRVDDKANSIAWLVWHLTRVQDDHLAGSASALGWDGFTDQVYVVDGFASRFALPFDDSAVGYGQTSDEVASVRAPATLLVDYHAAVHKRTVAFLDAVAPAEWDLVVDERWDPPVTLLARVASVLGDVTQHVGQAAYVRGVVRRSDGSRGSERASG